jgi:hypothetical protein
LSPVVAGFGGVIVFAFAAPGAQLSATASGLLASGSTLFAVVCAVAWVRFMRSRLRLARNLRQDQPDQTG